MGRVTTPDMSAHEIVVTGRVQGVGFRWYTRDAAARLGLAGWVANLPDGSVAVEVSGTAIAIENFLSALRDGPPGAFVSELRTAPIDPARIRVTHFEIR